MKDSPPAPAEAAVEPPNLQCPICFDTFKDAVTLEPCGHSFCAPCLSQYYGLCLERRQALECLYRCRAPERVVANFVARECVENLETKEVEERYTDFIEEEDVKIPRSLVKASCSFFTRYPLSLTSLKHDEVLLILNELYQEDTVPAKLATDSLWKLQLKLGPTSSVTRAANTSQLMMCGGIEILIKIMKVHEENATVVYYALLCLQHSAQISELNRKEIAKIGLKAILSAFHWFIGYPKVVNTALLVLSILLQNETHSNLIPDQFIEAGVVEYINLLLKGYGGKNEEILWGCLTVLALIAHQNGPPRNQWDDESVLDDIEVDFKRMCHMVSEEILIPMRAAVDQYRAKHGKFKIRTQIFRCQGLSTNNEVLNRLSSSQAEENINALIIHLEEAIKRTAGVLLARRRASRLKLRGVQAWCRKP